MRSPTPRHGANCDVGGPAAPPNEPIRSNTDETKAAGWVATHVARDRYRNVVERGFSCLKQWPGIATRYDKYAISHCGVVILGAMIQYRH